MTKREILKMSIPNFLLIFTCGASLIQHAAASRSRFIAPEGVPIRMKVIAAAFVVFGAANLWILATAPVTYGFLALGMMLYGASECLFVSACRVNRTRTLTVGFTTDPPEHLVLGGPYRLVRHPFYASYCLTWLAGAAATTSLVLLAMFFCMTLMYTWAARFEEKKFERSPLAARYAAYRANTGMLLPQMRARSKR